MLFIFAVYGSLEDFITLFLPLLKLVIAQGVKHDDFQALMVMSDRLVDTVKVSIGLESTPVLPLEEQTGNFFLNLDLPPLAEAMQKELPSSVSPKVRDYLVINDVVLFNQCECNQNLAFHDFGQSISSSADT